MISAIVFNFLIALYMLYTFALSGVNSLTLVSLLLVVAASIMYIIDICLEKGRAKKQEEAQAAELAQSQPTEQPAAPQQPSDTTQNGSTTDNNN